MADGVLFSVVAEQVTDLEQPLNCKQFLNFFPEAEVVPCF